MTKADKIRGTEEAWEKGGQLGNDIEYAAVASPEVHKGVEDALAMQMISIRLPKSVIESFKALAALEGVGYQPLMREALMRFADGEARRVLIEVAERHKKEKACRKDDGKKAA
ncbi:MAG: hypothetical protein GX772_00800 [Alcaligenaceae bacterium]|nr:hypothetical protein [Alcaligenaceae bacterium]